MADCEYAEMEWRCCKQAGHDGPHESAPLTAAADCPRCNGTGRYFALACPACGGTGRRRDDS